MNTDNNTTNAINFSAMKTKRPPEPTKTDTLKDVLKAILPIILLFGGASCVLAWIIGQVAK